MGLVRLNTVKLFFIAINSCVDPRIVIQNHENMGFSIDNCWFCSLFSSFVQLWQSRINYFSLMRRNYNILQPCFIFLPLGVALVGKSPPTTPDWSRHVSRASGPFLCRLPAKASRVEVSSTWRVLRGVDPRLESIKRFKSVKGTDHEMSWHQVWEKLSVSPK